MKKTTKIFIILAVILMIAGGAFCVTGRMLGGTLSENDLNIAGHTFGFVDDQKDHAASSEGKGDPEKTAFEADQIQSMEIDLAAGEICIKKAKAGERMVTIECANEKTKERFEWYMDGHCLVIQTKAQNGWSFADFIDVSLNIYIPDAIKLDALDLDVDAGALNCETNLICRSLDLDVDAGKAVFCGSVKESGDVEVNAGSAEIQLVNTALKNYNYDISVAAGTVDLSGKDIDEKIVSDQYMDYGASCDWQLDCNAGKIELKEK